MMKNVLPAVVVVGLLATPALAQSSPGTWNDLPDRFQVDTGYFHLSADTVLRYDGASNIDFEKDLGVEKDVNTFWVDGTWRIGRRHQLKLGYTQLNRRQPDHRLARDFTWGGRTFEAGVNVASETGTDILGGYYRFALVRNDRFEIGPTVGVGYLWLNARIQTTVSLGPVSGTIDQAASTGHITGAVGGYASAWPAKRLSLQGDFLYIKVSSGGTDASVTDWRLGANYYFHRNVGVGVQYKYDKYTYHRGILVTKLGGEVTFEGVQAFASFRF